MNGVLQIIFDFFSLRKNKLQNNLSLFFQSNKDFFFCLSSNNSAATKNLRSYFILAFILLFFVSSKNYGQCVFGNTVFGTPQSICYDSNSGSTQFSNVPLGSYVSVGVIEGMTYSFTVANNEYSTFHVRGTLYDANNTGTPLAYSDGGDYQNSTTINWTANFTGQVFIQYNDASNCSSIVGTPSTSIATITATYKGGNNLVDSPTIAGTNSWVGHVYDFAQTVGTLPATTDSAINYLGYFLQTNSTSGTTHSFNQNYGGQTVCFPFVAGGLPQTFYTQNFAVRYRMDTTADIYPEGCYFVNITGDDGVRLYVDGVLVFDDWSVHPANSFTNILVHLKGDSQLVLEYYENSGDNICNFSISPVDPTVNYVITPSPVLRCANSTTNLDGSFIPYFPFGSDANPSIEYHWQSSTDNFVTNVIYIIGATTEDYTVPATNPTENTTLYYRRKMSEKVTTGTPSCAYYSNSIAITTSVAPPSTPGPISGNPNQCINATDQIYSIDAVTNAVSYNWTIPTGWTITAGQGTTSITVNTGSTPVSYGEVKVQAINGCIDLYNPPTATLSVASSIKPDKPLSHPPTQIQCTAVTLQWDAVSNVSVYYIDIATDSTFKNFIVGYENLKISYYPSGGYYVSGLPSGTLYFRVRASAPCSNSDDSDVIAFTTLASITTMSPNQVICFGTQPSDLSVSGATSVNKWQSATDPSFTISVIDYYNGSPTLLASTIGNLSANTYFRAEVNAGSCFGVYSESIMITVTTPTLLGVSQVGVSCEGTGATITMTGLLPNSTSTINYTIDNAIQTAITNVVADATGTANFTTRPLTIAADDTKIAAITVVTTTSPSPSCSKDFTGLFTIPLSVKTNSGDIALNTVVPPSGTTTYPELTTATFSIDEVVGANNYYWSFPDGWTVTSTPSNLRTITVITGAKTESGTVSVTTDAAFCPSYLMVTLTDIPSAVPIADITQPTCPIPTGTIKVISPTPALGTVYTLTGINPPVVPETNDIGLFTGLAAGDYTITYTMGTDPTSLPLDVTIIPLVIPTTTWTGTWSNGFPDATKHVIFAAAYPAITSKLEACSCEIATGATIEVGVDGGSNEDAILYVVNELNIQDPSTITFYNNASLVQINNHAINNGSIIYKRNSTSLQEYDYVYWTSPVLGGEVEGFDNLNKSWNYIEGKWVSGGNMSSGVGCIIRFSDAVTQKAVFTGPPNNGIISVAAQTVGSNLIGNPYPSALDAELFITHNSTIINGGLYFWTHLVPRDKNDEGTKWVYSATDYATYTLSGSTKIGEGSESGSDAPSGYIASGQAFFVNGSGGQFEFTNEMRIGDSSKNAQFFKHKNSKKTKTLVKNRVWLNLTNDEGAFKQLLVGYIEGATNNFDKLYDAISLNGNPYINFYSINANANYSIQGRALPFDSSDEIPLGYKTIIEGIFKISIDKTDGDLKQQAIYLEDKLTNTIFDLTTGSYSFTTTKGEFKDRFVLRFKDSSKLGSEDFVSNDKEVKVSVKNRQIKINSFNQKISSVKVFDLNGKLLFKKLVTDKNELLIKDLVIGNQVLIVYTQLENGQHDATKIIYSN